MPNTTTAAAPAAQPPATSGATSSTASATTVTVDAHPAPAKPTGFAAELVAAVIAEVKAVGRNRALHTLVSGVASSVALAVVPVILANVGALRWDRSWWLATGTLVVSAAGTGAVDYLRHVLNPPKK